MKKSHSHELSAAVLNRLRKVAGFAGNEKAVDKDPNLVLEMLLYGIQKKIDLDDEDIKYLVMKHCSAEGIAIRSRWLREKKVA